MFLDIEIISYGKFKILHAVQTIIARGIRLGTGRRHLLVYLFRIRICRVFPVGINFKVLAPIQRFTVRGVVRIGGTGLQSFQCSLEMMFQNGVNVEVLFSIVIVTGQHRLPV